MDRQFHLLHGLSAGATGSQLRKFPDRTVGQSGATCIQAALDLFAQTSNTRLQVPAHRPDRVATQLPMALNFAITYRRAALLDDVDCPL